MLFDNANDLDISRVCESSKKKIPVWRKYGEGGKVKGAKFIYRLWGREPLSFGGGIFRILGGREVGPVFAIKGYKRGGGCLPMRGIIGILQSLRGEIR